MSRSSFSNPAYVFLAGKAHAKTASVRHESGHGPQTTADGGWSLLSFVTAAQPVKSQEIQTLRHPRRRRSRPNKAMQRSHSAVRFNAVVDQIDDKYQDDRYDNRRRHHYDSDDESGGESEEELSRAGQHNDARRPVKSRRPTGPIDGGSRAQKQSESSAPYASGELGDDGAYGGLHLLQGKVLSNPAAEPDPVPATSSHKKGFGAKLVGAAMRMGGGGGGKSHRRDDNDGDDSQHVPVSQMDDQKYMTAPSMTEAFAPVFADAASLYMPSRTYNADNDRSFHENLTNLPRNKASGFASIVESAVAHKVVETDAQRDTSSKRKSFMQTLGGGGGDKGSVGRDPSGLSGATRQRLKELALIAKLRAEKAAREEDRERQTELRPQQHRSRSRSDEDLDRRQRQTTASSSDKRRHSRLPATEAIDQQLRRMQLDAADAPPSQSRPTPPRSHNLTVEPPPVLTFEPPTPIEASMQGRQQKTPAVGDARPREPTFAEVRSERVVVNEQGKNASRQTDVRVSGEVFRMEQRREGDDVLVIGRDGRAPSSTQQSSTHIASDGQDDDEANERRHHHRRHHGHRSRHRSSHEKESRADDGEETRERRHRRHRDRDVSKSEQRVDADGKGVDSAPLTRDGGGGGGGGEDDQIAWEERPKHRTTQGRAYDDELRSDSRNNDVEHRRRHHSRDARHSSERERRHGNSERQSSERERRHGNAERLSSERDRRGGNAERLSSERERRVDNLGHRSSERGHRHDDATRASFERSHRGGANDVRSMDDEREREQPRTRMRGASQQYDDGDTGDDPRHGETDLRERRRSRRMSYGDRFASAIVDEAERRERGSQRQKPEGVRRQTSHPMLSEMQRSDSTHTDRKDSNSDNQAAASAAAVADVRKPKTQKSGLIRTLMHGMQHGQGGQGGTVDGADVAAAQGNLDEGNSRSRQRGMTGGAVPVSEPKRLAKIVGPEDEQRLGMAIDFARERMQRELSDAKAEKRRQMSMHEGGDQDGSADLQQQSQSSASTAAPQQSRPSLDRARKTMTTLLTRKMSTKAMRNDDEEQQQAKQQQQPRSIPQRQSTIYVDQPSPVPTIAPERERAHLDEAFREAVRAGQHRKDQQKMFQNPSLIQPHTQMMQMPPW